MTIRLADRNPFPPAIWRRALKLAGEYHLVIGADPDVGYVAHTIEMPLAMSDGRTVSECVANAIDAAASGIATMLEAGQTPPSPAREGLREQQVNIRLSAHEKFRLDQASRTQGFRSLSDFMRAAALRAAQ